MWLNKIKNENFRGFRNQKLGNFRDFSFTSNFDRFDCIKRGKA